eukprot:jgi/Psemu1/41044/gm1.41044_g
MVPKSREENVPYFQRNDRLYIFPTACVLTKTKFAHVNFEDRPEELVTGILELSGLEDQHKNQTCVTRFLQYDVNSQQEVHQRYSYLPEIGTIFTPLTEKLAIYLWEKSDDLSWANLLVQFLDDNVVNNYGKGTGELNLAFKHLQGPWNLFIPPWDVQVDGGNVAKTNNLNEGRNNNSGSTVTGECSKNKPNQSKESGIDTTKVKHVKKRVQM